MNKDLMTSEVKIWHMLVLSVVIYTAVFFVPIVDEYFTSLCYLVLVFPPTTYFMNLFYYTQPNMYKSEIMLPVKKSHVIISRYATYLLLILVNVIPMIGLLYIRYMLGRVSNLNMAISQMALGVSNILIFGGLLLLLVFIFGQDKIKSFSIISFIGMFACTVTLTRVLMYIFNFNDLIETYTRHTEIYVIFFLLCVLFYTLSCVISTIVFNKKQF